MVSVAAVCSTKLTVTLEPALDWNEAIHEDNLLFLRVVSPEHGSVASCEELCPKVDCSEATMYDPVNGPGTYSSNRSPLTNHACAFYANGDTTGCCQSDHILDTCVVVWGNESLYDCYFPSHGGADVVAATNEYFYECGGHLVLDLSQYVELEFVVRASPGKEIKVTANPYGGPVDFELSLKAEECGKEWGYQSLNGYFLTPKFVGSDAEDLQDQLDAENSFVDIGHCEIFTRITTSGTGLMQHLTWSVPLDRTQFSAVGNATFSYSTKGYSWIRTSPDGAIVDLIPMTLTPTESPVETTSPGTTSPGTTSPGLSSSTIIKMSFACFMITLEIVVDLV